MLVFFESFTKLISSGLIYIYIVGYIDKGKYIDIWYCIKNAIVDNVVHHLMAYRSLYYSYAGDYMHRTTILNRGLISII